MSAPLAHTPADPVTILMVDDQPAKLLSYEVILRELGEELITASSGREALAQLLKHDVAVVLIDVQMPELDGFELAAMIRQHPRFQQTALIFVSAIHLSDFDRIKGYEAGAVDFIQQKGQNPSVDSYSAFRDNDQAALTGLAAFLRGKGVTTLDLCGLATDYCVKFSAIDAVEMLPGVAVRFIEDASRGIDPAGVRAAIDEMRTRGVAIIRSRDALA